MKHALGFDFGTESVRALLASLDGKHQTAAVAKYAHGQITETLPTTNEKLPVDFALQHPGDWIDSASKASRAVLKKAGITGRDVVGIGVDFTSCTMLPTLADGTPLCRTEKWHGEKFAWPKLWKHHHAGPATELINQVARRRQESWLPRYGGTIGLEWFFPKILETLTAKPTVYSATDVWLEAGDWFVWQLVGGPARLLPRSTCQAGYKACWNANTGYPTTEFFKEVHPRLERVVSEKMPGRLLPPGTPAGGLIPSFAKRFGLEPDTPVSVAIIDAHAGVPGAGVADPGTLVMVLGTSSCHMLNSEKEILIPGVAGVVYEGIQPGLFGYETGQAAVGDAFDWCRRLTGAKDFAKLDELAAALPPGAEGVAAWDWLNGCRTPLMDGSLRGSFTGLGLHHRAEHLYRALLEATAFGLRWIVDLLTEAGIAVNRLVATGGLPHHNPLLISIYADVLGKPILIHPSTQGPAVGAAILGAIAAGPKATGFRSRESAIHALAGTTGKGKPPAVLVRPTPGHHAIYEHHYRRYRLLPR